MKSYKALCATFLLLVMTCINVFAVPVIDFSSPDQYQKLQYGDSQTFTVTATESIDTWEWYVNGVVQGVDSNSHTVTFTDPGQNNVTVTATNTNGVDSYSFYPYVHRQIATGDTEKIEETYYDDIIQSVEDNNFESFFKAITMPGVAILGSFYYLFIIGLPAYMIWNRQQSLLLPSVVALVAGGILLPFMPEPYVKFMQLCVVLSASAVLWALYKDR